MSRNALILAAAALPVAFAASANAAGLMYALTNPDGGPQFAGSRSIQSPTGFIFDDIQINLSDLGVGDTHLLINQIVIGLVRGSQGAPGGTLTVGVAPTLNLETSPGSNIPQIDLSGLQVSAPVPFSAYNPPVASSTVQLVTVPVNMSIPLEFAFPDPADAVALFALGVSINDGNSGQNAWALHQYDTLSSPYLNGDWAYEADGSTFAINTPFYTSFVAQVYGSPVPEPASLSLLALGGLALRRSRRV